MRTTVSRRREWFIINRVEDHCSSAVGFYKFQSAATFTCFTACMGQGRSRTVENSFRSGAGRVSLWRSRVKNSRRRDDPFSGREQGPSIRQRLRFETNLNRVTTAARRLQEFPVPLILGFPSPSSPVSSPRSTTRDVSRAYSVVQK